MPADQTLTQPIRQRVEIHAAAERAEGRRGAVRARSGPADGMTARAHSRGQRPTLPLECAWLAIFGEAGRQPEQQQDDGQYCGQVFSHMRTIEAG